MVFHVGDPVMHWVYGFGTVVGIEERVISGQKTLYYAISIRDLTVWVPADDKVQSRLRTPTTKDGFKELFAILSGAGEPLPEDRQDRKIWLSDMLKDGRAASLCRVLRDLSTFHQVRSLNDNDQNLMKRAREALISEWIHTFAITISEAENELQRMLAVDGINERK